MRFHRGTEVISSYLSFSLSHQTTKSNSPFSPLLSSSKETLQSSPTSLRYQSSSFCEFPSIPSLHFPHRKVFNKSLTVDDASICLLYFELQFSSFHLPYFLQFFFFVLRVGSFSFVVPSFIRIHGSSPYYSSWVFVRWVFHLNFS